MTKNMIQNTLAHNFTIKTGSAMTGDQLGIETFGQWKSSVAKCHREFYKYECAKHNAASQGDKANVDCTKAFNALQEILDLVGDVNGHKVVKNREMLDVLAVKTHSDREPLAGRAETINSELKIVRKQLDNVATGMNPEYIEGLQAKEAELEEELKQAKKETGSCAPMKARNSESTFRKKFEKELYRAVIKPQAMKTWEELEAEAEARKAERKAAKQAKRQAEAKAKAEAEAQAK